MVLTQRSSQSSVSGKKQQSISNFFSKNTSISNAVPITPSSNAIPSSPIATTVAHDENAFLPTDNPNAYPEDHASSTPKRPLDLQFDVDSEENIPIRKRRRVSSEEPDRLTTSLKHPTSHQNGISTDPKQSLPSNQNGKPRPPPKTSRYTFSSSQTIDEDTQVDDEETKRRKEILHQRFVKKLGPPDSIAEIKRRRWQEVEETASNYVDLEEDEASEEAMSAKLPAKSKRGVAGKKGGSKLTPMEKQYLDIKRNHLDTILVVEVGYKFKFFGEDARIAAKELGIVCIPGKFRYDEHPSEAHLDRFATASIPVHRLHVHVKRLVDAGHKVGVVRQLETAALKAAGDNRNTPFIRKLTNMYTKGTYVDEVDGLEAPSAASSSTAPAAGYLLCITESNAKGWGTDEKVRVGILSVQPATGDIIYDDFEDGFMRSEIETRLLHIAPCEILIVGGLSKATEKLVQHLSGSKTNVFGDKIRVERVEKPKTMVAQAYSHVSNFYAGKLSAGTAGNDEGASKLLENVLKLAEEVTVCLSAMITHLSEYGLEHVFDLTKYFQSFSARSHMMLNGNTLSSLEIYQNQTDRSEKGSLFWTLDRTKTRFGRRLLRKWVGRPLLIRKELEERITAVEELRNDERSMKVDRIKHLLSQIRTDLEKSLIRIYYGKCTRPELLAVLQTLQKISSEYLSVKSLQDAGFQSSAINRVIASLPLIYEDVVAFLDKINVQAAKDDDKYSFFLAEAESEETTEHKLGIAGVEHDLDAHRAHAAEKIKRKRVEYVTVAGIEYLIEVDNNQLKHVPASWAKISGTKKVSRFHTPEVIRLIRERDQHKEALAASCDQAFAALLLEIATKYQPFRDCVQGLAILDCWLSLAAVASQPDYVKPEFIDSPCIAIEQGRHPMVEQLLLESYVPNDVALQGDETRALLITGPNMGGKSSYVRQIALIAIMGQIGSYVPASSAKLGMLDAVFTRMGAFDNMMAGESTFMVELSETSDILKQATPRSLIILDELGRGTSTHDGVAIAQSVLDYVVRDIQSLTLFITHYQNLSSVAKGFANNQLRNVHMKFHEGGEDGQEITFLYEVGEGVAHRSYGLNVARLANIPDSVLQLAAVKSKALEDLADEKNLENISYCLSSMLGKSSMGELEQVIGCIEQL